MSETSTKKGHFDMDALTPAENPRSTPTVPAPPIPPDAGKRQRRKVFMLTGGILGVLCVCVALCVALAGSSILGVAGQRDAVASVVDAEMRAMASRDVNRAYALFSTRAQGQMPLSRLQDALTDGNFALYDGYMRNQVMSLSIGPHADSNPAVPQGLVANAAGTIAYQDGYNGQFQAVLEQEAGTWKLDDLTIIVPPQKVEDHLKSAQ